MTDIFSGISINFTVLLSVFAFCLAAMGTIVKVFGKRSKPEDLPGKNVVCQQHIKDLNRVETMSKENDTKNQELMKVINQIEKETALLKKETESNTRSNEDLKQSNREIAKRLDELLIQLTDFISN
jgi:septal ring factor EnvC (AmiA/AmiB activator)